MQKVALLLLILVCGCLVDAQVPADSQSSRKESEIWFEPFERTIGEQKVVGELGHLIVRENRQRKDSRLIELVFVRLKSTAAKPGYPVVYLDGGPGSSAINLGTVPDYLNTFMKLREVGDVILLDQRGVGRSRPNLGRPSPKSLPLNVFADRRVAFEAFNQRVKSATEYFRSQGVELESYNTKESAHDVDDLRKALGVEKLNLVGFSYGTHLGLACIRYHGPNLNRVVLIGTEGPDHTDKLPFTSDQSLVRLAQLAANDPEIGAKVPDLVSTLITVMDRLEKEPAIVTVTDRRGNKPVKLTVGKSGLQFLIMRDLGDTNDLPIFPAWFYTMAQGDYSILTRFAERRYNQFGAGISLMTVYMDSASGASAARQKQIAQQAKSALLGDMVNFPIPELRATLGKVDLGDEYRSPIKTSVPTLFISGTLDNNTPPSQADEVRLTFSKNTHLVIENAGHESMLVHPPVQQTMVDYLRGQDVSSVKIDLPPLKFVPIP